MKDTKVARLRDYMSAEQLEEYNEADNNAHLRERTTIPKTINIKRISKRGKPFYRIIVTDSIKRISGGWIESIGRCSSVSGNKELQIDEERMNYWLSVGAKMSPSVKKIFGR